VLSGRNIRARRREQTPVTNAARIYDLRSDSGQNALMLREFRLTPML
jgi:hypothetical protein